MPVDLKHIGPPKDYPPRAPGLRVWIAVWLVCVVVVERLAVTKPLIVGNSAPRAEP